VAGGAVVHLGALFPPTLNPGHRYRSALDRQKFLFKFKTFKDKKLGSQNRSTSCFSGFWSVIARFFAAAPGAIKNHLNTAELIRIAVTTLTAGGGIFSLLKAVEINAGQIFPSPADAGLATAVLTLILEVFRRLDHGQNVAIPQGR
jgi:hypothetical protein